MISSHLPTVPVGDYKLDSLPVFRDACSVLIPSTNQPLSITSPFSKGFRCSRVMNHLSIRISNVEIMLHILSTPYFMVNEINMLQFELLPVLDIQG